MVHSQMTSCGSFSFRETMGALSEQRTDGLSTYGVALRLPVLRRLGLRSLVGSSDASEQPPCEYAAPSSVPCINLIYPHTLHHRALALLS